MYTHKFVCGIPLTQDKAFRLLPANSEPVSFSVLTILAKGILRMGIIRLVIQKRFR